MSSFLTLELVKLQKEEKETVQMPKMSLIQCENTVFFLRAQGLETSFWHYFVIWASDIKKYIKKTIQFLLAQMVCLSQFASFLSETDICSLS